MGSACCTKSTDTSPYRDDPSPELVDALDAALVGVRDDITARMLAKPSGKQFDGYITKDISDEVRRLLRLWDIDNIEAVAEKLAAAADGPLRRVENQSVRQGLAWVLAVRPDIADEVPLDADPDDDGDLPMSFGQGNPEAAAILERRRTGFTRSMEGAAETLATNLGNTLSEGVASGESIGKLTSRVRGVFDAESPTGEKLSRARAERIARTETAEAQTEGQIAGIKGSGLQVRKLWRLAPNACEFCRAVAKEFNSKSQAIDIDKPFVRVGSTVRGVDGGTLNVNFRDIRGAPLHPNDRCDIQLIVEGVDRVVRRPE